MRPTEIDVREHRKPTHEIDPLFLERWSSRALSGEPLEDEQLMKLFEAARWAPSSYNNQPWRFVWARRGSEHWRRLFDLMVPFNQGWAEKAAVLVVIVSKKTFDRNGKPAATHSFDTGAAWMSLALQAARMGLVAHAMQGFDYDRAARDLGVPEDHAVEAMCAVGHPGEIGDLPEDLQQKDLPNDRRPLEDITFEGRMP